VHGRITAEHIIANKLKRDAKHIIARMACSSAEKKTNFSLLQFQESMHFTNSMPGCWARLFFDRIFAIVHYAITYAVYAVKVLVQKSFRDFLPHFYTSRLRAICPSRL